VTRRESGRKKWSKKGKKGLLCQSSKVRLRKGDKIGKEGRPEKKQPGSAKQKSLFLISGEEMEGHANTHCGEEEKKEKKE